MSCCGMTVAQAATLEALADGALRLVSISKRLGITPSTLTRNLARLEERGFVIRIGDPDDGRAQRVALTDSGRKPPSRSGVRRSNLPDQSSTACRQGPSTSTLDGFNQLLTAVRRATERCCPGAYDHLVSSCPRGRLEDR